MPLHNIDLPLLQARRGGNTSFRNLHGSHRHACYDHCKIRKRSAARCGIKFEPRNKDDDLYRPINIHYNTGTIQGGKTR